MRKTGIIIFIVGCFCLSNSCYNDKEEKLYPASFNRCDTANTTFSFTILPIIQNSCALSGCHVPGTGRQVFTDSSGFQDNIVLVESKAVKLRTMPPPGNKQLSECEVKKLQHYIELHK